MTALPDRIVTPVEQKPMSTQRFVSGLVGALDVVKIAQIIGDIWMLGDRTEYTKHSIPDYIEQPFYTSKIFAKRWDDGTLATAKEYLKNTWEYQITELNKTMITSSGAAAAGQMQSLGVNTRLSMMGSEPLFDAVVDLPYRYGLLKYAERYWRAKMASGALGPTDTFIMWKKGIFGKDRVERSVKEEMGLSDKDTADYIEHMDYDPGTMEIWRAARNTPITRAWIKKKLGALGFNDEDLAIYLEAALKETVKEEIGKAVGLIQSDYAVGLYKFDDLRTLFTKWKMSPEEIVIQEAICENKRASAILKTLISRDIYYRKNKPMTPEWLFTSLTTVQPTGRGLDFFVANAIVSEEMAKVGKWWTAPDQNFSVNVDPQSITIQKTQTGYVVVGVVPAYGWNKPVALTQTGAPEGVTITFTPSSGTPSYNSSMKIEVGAEVASNTYPITVKGTWTTVVSTTILTLIVTA